MFRRGRNGSPSERLYAKAEAALAKLCEDGDDRLSSPEAAVYQETMAVLRRMRAVLEGVGDGVFVTDDHGKIRLWNRAAERVTGTSEKKAVGRTCSGIMCMSVRDKGLGRETRELDCSNGCAILRELRGKPPGTSIEVTRVRPGANEQQLLVSVSPVEGDDGKPVEVVHSVRDITRLREADDAKTMFLATASHELKTPLTVILGFTQTLLAGWLKDEERQQALTSIEKRAQHLSRIVDRLLLTGRIEAGRVRLQLTSVPIKEMLQERAESLSAATGRSVLCDVPDNVPNVLADEPALITVIDHLLDNAVKYSPDGGDVTITASIDRNNVVIEVEDEGIGMNADEAAQCFDQFWQAEQSDVRRFGGTGVGLYIVKSMVEGMGGQIGVRSAAGEGTTFIVTLRTAERDVAMREEIVDPGLGSPSIIQEFMRQLGVPGGSV